METLLSVTKVELQQYIREQLIKFGCSDVDIAVKEVYASLQEGKEIGTFVYANTSREKHAAKIGRLKDPDKVRDKATKQALPKLNKLLSDTESKMVKSVLNYFISNDKESKRKLKPVSKKSLEKELKTTIEKTYYSAYRLGVEASGITTRAKTPGLTDPEKVWIYSAYIEEMKYFNKFFSQMTRGTSKTNVLTRVHYYVETIRSIFEAGKVRSSPPDTLIYWILNPAEHCPECIILNRFSPYTVDSLPTTPKGGSTRCLMNCKCSLRFKKVDSSMIKQVQAKNKKSKVSIRLKNSRNSRVKKSTVSKKSNRRKSVR